MSSASVTDAWLGQLCTMVPGVRRAVFVAAAGAPMGKDGWWPSGGNATETVDASLLSAARACLEAGASSSKKGEGSGAGPSAHLLAVPLGNRSARLGAVALALDGLADSQLRVVEQLVGWGGAWLRLLRDSTGDSHRALATLGAGTLEDAGESRLIELFDVLAAALDSNHFDACAHSVVGQLAGALDCDRVSVGKTHGRRVQLAALSHTAKVDRKTRLARAVEAAMAEAVDQGVSVRWSAAGEPGQQVSRAHAALSAHGTLHACSVPLANAGEVHGALTLERAEDLPFDDDTLEFCEALGALLGPVLALKRSAERPWLLTTRDAMASSIGAVVGRRFLAAKLAAAIIAAGLAWASLSSSEHRITADASLESEQRRVVVAPQDGFIAASVVRAGDAVSEGEVLGQLETQDLELERGKWVNRRAQLRKEYREALASREGSRIRITRAQIAQAEAELKLVEEQLGRTKAIAPFDGVVLQGDLSQRIGAPVTQGEVLFELAPADVQRVVLAVDERDISAIREGQIGQLALAAMPADPIPFVVKRLTPVSNVVGGANVFRVEASVSATSDQLLPGMQGVAKVAVAQRSRLWIWTHRLTNWLGLKLWRLAP